MNYITICIRSNFNAPALGREQYLSEVAFI